MPIFFLRFWIQVFHLEYFSYGFPWDTNAGLLGGNIQFPCLKTLLVVIFYVHSNGQRIRSHAVFSGLTHFYFHIRWTQVGLQSKGSWRSTTRPYSLTYYINIFSQIHCSLLVQLESFKPMKSIIVRRSPQSSPSNASSGCPRAHCNLHRQEYSEARRLKEHINTNNVVISCRQVGEILLFLINNINNIHRKALGL